jgi:micrococcal nuclease
MELYNYRAKITSVYDGDTCTALVDLGFRITFEIKIRLLGIDTPELRGEEREMGLKSKARLEELVLNKDVIIKTDKDKTEKYGRWLAEIFVDDLNVNQTLLSEGLATKYL